MFIELGTDQKEALRPVSGFSSWVKGGFSRTGTSLELSIEEVAQENRPNMLGTVSGSPQMSGRPPQCNHVASPFPSAERNGKSGHTS